MLSEMYDIMYRFGNPASLDDVRAIISSLYRKPSMHSLSERKPIYLVGVVLLGLLFFLWTAPVTPQDELIESVWLMEDPRGSLGVQDVLAENFQPVTNYLMLGYNTSAQWLRVRILPATDGGDVVLLFRSGAPDTIRFYAQAITGLHETNTDVDVGLYQSVPPTWPSPIQGFRINPPDGGGEYLVEIKSAGAILLNMTAQPLSEAIVMTERTFIVQIAYLTTLFFIMLWSLQMFTVSGLSLFGWFAAMQFATLVHNMFFLGYGEKLFSNFSADTILPLFRLSVFLGAFLTITFHRAVMIRFEPSRLAIRLFDVQLCVIAVSLIIFVSFEPLLGLQITVACLGFSPIVFLVNAATARSEATPGLTIVRVIYVILSLSFLLNVLGFLGFMEFKLLIIYGYLIHGLTTALLIFVFLHLVLKDIFLKARNAEKYRIKMEYQTEIEQDKNQTLLGFIHMLGHEAKNAMSVMQMSTAAERISEAQRARADNAISGLTSIINSCNQAVRLDTNDLTVTLKKCDLADLLRQLRANLEDAERITLQADDPAIVQGDPVLLEVLFRNLLDNAIKYASSGSDISIVLKREIDGYSLLFENEPGAAGMPDPARVFEKYYRSPHAQEEIGSGLGLYIVHRLVDLMGGSIEYMPTKYHIRFKLWIPF